MPKTTVYSLADVKEVMYHQDVGQCVLSAGGMGKIPVFTSPSAWLAAPRAWLSTSM